MFKKVEKVVKITKKIANSSYFYLKKAVLPFV